MAKKAKKAPAKKKAGAKKRPAKKKAPAMDMLLVGSKTKAVLKGYGVNVAGDAVDGLNMVVHYYVQQAAARAAANGRKTVRAHDFHVG